MILAKKADQIEQEINDEDKLVNQLEEFNTFVAPTSTSKLKKTFKIKTLTKYKANVFNNLQNENFVKAQIELKHTFQ
jgi:ribosome-binding protein aMBF1 (putative translation factor)